MKILIYAEPNPNLIDGSSVWLASLVETLADHTSARPTVLLSAEVEHEEVIGHLLDNPMVRWVPPAGFQKPGMMARLRRATGRKRKLTPREAVDAIERLMEKESHQHVLVRGRHTLAVLTANERLAGRTWAYLTDPRKYASCREDLVALNRVVRGFLCQTPQARSYVQQLLDGESIKPIALLPPMIPPFDPEPRSSPDTHSPRLGYAGKLSPPYRILEMLEAFRKIRREFPAAEFHLVGAKFHNAPYVEGFEKRVCEAIDTIPGIVWHGGVSRQRTLSILSRVHVASSWRDESFDDSLELSTKVLECAGLGLPVLLNPSRVQQSVFGDAYPAWISSEREFIGGFARLVTNPDLYSRTSERVQALAGAYTFPVIGEKLLQELSVAGDSVAE